MGPAPGIAFATAAAHRVMIILEHSTYDDSSIGPALGAPEYSYWFVRKAFRRVLESFGILAPVLTVDSGTELLVSSARRHGSDCVLLSFNPPQYLPDFQHCPTIPVFAWEFDRIPDQSWNANPQEDWRLPLGRAGFAITHSGFAADAVRRTMGEDYPIWSIPAPVFEPMRHHAQSAAGYRAATVLSFASGVAIDSWAVRLDVFALDRSRRDAAQGLRSLRRATASPERPPQTIRIEGVVYTSVFNPGDGRKNWEDMIAAFVFAFRDTTDATLILKLTLADMVDATQPLLEHMAKLGAFRCRIILIHGLLDQTEYSSLVDATSFTVNASQGEGQCLPLMEFMSAGRPAVAPRHTSMLDYLDEDSGFLVPSHLRPAFWPHDERQFQTCRRHEIAFDGLVRALRESYQVATQDPARYAAMSAAAMASLERYCGDAVVTSRLAEVLRFALGKSLPERDPPDRAPAEEVLT